MKKAMRDVLLTAVAVCLLWLPAAHTDAVVEGEAGVEVEAEVKGGESLFGTLDYILLAAIGGIAAWYLLIRVGF